MLVEKGVGGRTVCEWIDIIRLVRTLRSSV